jgi:hypothetical protein
MNALKGVEMELRDCAFPALRDIILTEKPEVAFEGVDYALLVGIFIIIHHSLIIFIILLLYSSSFSLRLFSS